MFKKARKGNDSDGFLLYSKKEVAKQIYKYYTQAIIQYDKNG